MMKGLGARERELGATLYGVLRQIPCANGLVCINNTCQSSGKTIVVHSSVPFIHLLFP